MDFIYARACITKFFEEHRDLRATVNGGCRRHRIFDCVRHGAEKSFKNECNILPTLPLIFKTKVILSFKLIILNLDIIFNFQKFHLRTIKKIFTEIYDYSARVTTFKDFNDRAVIKKLKSIGWKLFSVGDS